MNPKKLVDINELAMRMSKGNNSIGAWRMSALELCPEKAAEIFRDALPYINIDSVDLLPANYENYLNKTIDFFSSIKQTKAFLGVLIDHYGKDLGRSPKIASDLIHHYRTFDNTPFRKYLFHQIQLSKQPRAAIPQNID